MSLFWLSFPPKKPTSTPTTSQISENVHFCYRTTRPPSASFGHISAKNQATRPALEPNWASGPDAKCCCTRSRHLPGSPKQRPPFHTPLSFAYYAIIIMEVDDDGTEIILHNHPDSGHRCRGSGRGIGCVGRHSGREDWLQSDRHSWQKNHGELGGDTTIIYYTVVIAGGFFYFLPIQIIVFKYIWIPAQRCKWQHTTNAIKMKSNNQPYFLYSLAKAIIVITHCQQAWAPVLTLLPQSSGQHPMLILNRHSISMP